MQVLSLELISPPNCGSLYFAPAGTVAVASGRDVLLKDLASCETLAQALGLAVVETGREEDAEEGTQRTSATNKQTTEINECILLEMGESSIHGKEWQNALNGEFWRMLRLQPVLIQPETAPAPG